MTLSKYIKELQKLEKLNPRAKVVYCSDEEGNSFDYVVFPPTLGYWDGQAFYSGEDLNEWGYAKKKLNAIIIN